MAEFVGGPLDGMRIPNESARFPFIHFVEEVYPLTMETPPGARRVKEYGYLRPNADGGYDTYEHTRVIQNRVYERETQPGGDVRYVVRPVEEERG